VARELEIPESRVASISLAQIPKYQAQAPADVMAIQKLEAEPAQAEAIVLAQEIGAEC
jgi:hypothetical protein